MRKSMGILGFGALVAFSTAATAGNEILFKAGAIDPLNVKGSSIAVFSAEDRVQGATTEYFVVQFDSALVPEDQRVLGAQGLEVLRYIPDHSLLVRGGRSEVERFSKGNSRVRAFLPYLTTFKLSPDLEPRSIFTLKSRSLVLVRFFDEGSQELARPRLAEISSVQIKFEGDGVAVIGVSDEHLEALAAIEGVEFVEPYLEMKTMMAPLGEEALSDPGIRGDFTDLTGYESGTLIMNFSPAWDQGWTGRDQVVGMADTGLDMGVLGTLFKDFENTKSGFPFGMWSQSWADPMGHGTHVAGSILSSGAGSSGHFRGGAHEAQMVAEGMWSDMLGNITVPPQLNLLFDKAYSEGARIHTNSWGSPQGLGSYNDSAVQVDRYMWEHQDLLILFAAGNSGVDGNKDGKVDSGSIGTPGTAKNALTVGASENLLLAGGIQRKLGELLNGEPWGVEPLASDTLSNNPNGLASFSSRGPTLDGRLKPDLVAPGTNIVSNCSHVEKASDLWGAYNEDYCYSGGTSMSTPLTAGAAAVVRQYLVNHAGIASPSGAVVKAVLMASAVDLYPGQYGTGKGQEILTPGPNSDQGYGRVNVEGATSADLFVADERVGLSQGQAKEYDVAVPTGKSARVTLVYTDAPGAVSAAKALVNDLDLEVKTSNAQTLKSDSKINNHEFLLVKGADQLHVKVSGTSVVQGLNGAQPYALVVSFQ